MILNVDSNESLRAAAVFIVCCFFLQNVLLHMLSYHKVTTTYFHPAVKSYMSKYRASTDCTVVSPDGQDVTTQANYSSDLRS